MSFLFPTPTYFLESAPAPFRPYGGSCSRALLPQDFYEPDLELELAMVERARSAHREQALRRKQQREFAQLVQQLAMEEVENQRREHRRRVLEAKKAALAEARRHEAAERRRAEAARKRHLAQVRAAKIQQALLEEAAREAARSHAHRPTTRYVRIGDLLLRITEDDDEEYSDAQESVDDEEDTNEPMALANAAHDDENAEVAVALAKLSAHDRDEPSTADKTDETLEDACHALAEDTPDAMNDNTTADAAVESPTPEADAIPEASAPADASHDASDDSSAKDTSAAKEPQLLFARDFPSIDTEYGRQVRELVNADTITVEVSSANEGSIRIGGLWRMQAPERPPSPPRSPRSAHVSDVDENGEEIVVSVPEPVESDTASEISLDDTDTVPAPKHLEHVRAELTDDGFRLWLDAL